MSVESSPGEGSTFRVFLPASHEPVSRRSRPSQPSVPIRGTGTILVIDDERAVRSTAARMLGEFGYRAIVAESGQDGLHTLAQEASPVRLVMLDLTMPAMDGKDTLEQLRRANISVPVLLMSGYQQQEVVGLLGQPNVVGFLQKPIQMEELGRALRGAFCAVPSAS
jgi:CheY-like chemotaxis protein